MIAPASARPGTDRRTAWLVWAGPAACAAGFAAYRLGTAAPWTRALEMAAIAGLAALLAWVPARMRRWRMADCLVVVWAAALAVFAGPLAALAGIALAAGAVAIGSVLVMQTATALAIGAAVIAGFLGWLLPLPIHTRGVYLLVLGAVVVARRRALLGCVAAVRDGWRDAVDHAPRAAAFAVLAVGIASSAGWLPTVQSDDLGYHLGLPWQLMERGRYALDVRHQVWALAPWMSDVLHAIAQVLAGEEARGAWNACWLLASAGLLWRICGQLGVDVPLRWGALALFGTLPPLVVLVGGMQTELAATAVTLALATLVLAPPSVRGCIASALLVGALLGLKVMHPFAAAGLIAAAAWRARALMRRHAWLAPLAIVLVAAIGGSSYAYAWTVTGNPVLPLFNGHFRSDAFPPVNFADARWPTGFDPLVAWHLTFATARHVEGWNGGFGFALVALIGAALVACRERDARLVFACALFAVMAPLAAMQYARYAFVGMVLLLPVAMRGLAIGIPAAHARGLVAGLCIANFVFIPNAHWVLHTGGIKRALAVAGADAPFLRRYAPERLAIAHIRESSPDAVVIDLSGAAHAELAGRGRTTTWYAPALQARALDADTDATGARWAAVLREERITHAVMRPAQLPAARRAGLARAGAHRVLTVGEVECWRISGTSPR